ncbi:MAG: lactate racemase domain-containing protein, partial [Bacteroidota bacterium]
FTPLGTTERGTPVTIHQAVTNADKVLVVSEVNHHYFAGFGGGAKTVMPGVAAYDSIVQNHRLTLTGDGDFHPLCFDGNLEGNPVYEDIVDAVQFYPPIFFVGVILNEDGDIFHAIAGDIIQAHRREALIADGYYSIPVRELADMVILSAGGYPQDVNFVQTHKSIQHAYYAVKRGGVILCVAECGEGIGSETLLDWFRFHDRKDMAKNLLNQYTLHGHTALSLQKKLDSVHVVLLSSLPSESVTRMRMVPVLTPAEAIQVAESFLAPAYTCYVLEDGGKGVPRYVM